ncbi:hypothetical protein ACEQPO_10065 [Bacillus sp. SL00103]
MNLLVSGLGPAAKAMVNSLGLKLDILDVGWPIGAAISLWYTRCPFDDSSCAFLLNVILLSVNFYENTECGYMELLAFDFP